MPRQSPSPTPAELADEASTWIVGGGTLALALFPLALPALVLLVIGLIPLLVPALAAGVLVAALALPLLLVRTMWRLLLRAWRRGPTIPSGRRDPRLQV